MRAIRTIAAAPPDAVWQLLAQPREWPRWAPHLRGAIGLGDPEVRAGTRGLVRLAGLPLVPAQILQVRHRGSERRWSWRVGPVTMDHLVVPADPAARTTEVTITVVAREPLETLVAVGYGPLVRLLLVNLGRVAAARA